MKEFTYNLTVVCTFAAILALAGFSTGCVWTTTRPTDPYAEAPKAAKSELVGKSGCFEKNGVEHCGKIKEISSAPRFIPVLIGYDEYGLQLYGLPEGHELLARGYHEGEVLLSCNGESFRPERHALIGKVVTGDLRDAHLTVFRHGREVTLKPETL